MDHAIATQLRGCMNDSALRNRIIFLRRKDWRWMFSKAMKRDHGLAKCEIWIDGLQCGHARLRRFAADHNDRRGVGCG